jgi:hypothetical protein
MDRFIGWWRKPYSADMDVPHWFLFVLLLAVIGASWSIVLRHVIKGVQQ